MYLIEKIFDLSLGQAVLINIIIIAINILFIFIVKKLVNKKYKKTNSVEQTLYLEQMLFKYAMNILILISTFIIAFILMPHFEWMGDYKVFGGLFIVYVEIFLILIISQLVLYDINKELRKTTSTKKEQVGKLLKFLIFSVVPVIIMITVIELNPFENLGGEIWEKYGVIILMLIIYSAISLIMPLFTKFLLKAVDFEEGELKDELIQFVKSAGIKKFRLFLWPTKSDRHANALVSGLIRKDIFIADYLTAHFSQEEIKSILAHEIGHVKRHHLWKRTGFIIGMIIIFPIIGKLMAAYENHYNTEIPIWLGIGVLAILFIGYIIFLRHYVNRKQESQADEFAFKMGIKPIVYAGALYKITKLNNTVMKFNKIDEKMQTHPSTARRIRNILKQGNITEDEFNKYINEQISIED